MDGLRRIKRHALARLIEIPDLQFSYRIACFCLALLRLGQVSQTEYELFFNRRRMPSRMGAMSGSAGKSADPIWLKPAVTLVAIMQMAAILNRRTVMEVMLSQISDEGLF